MDVRQAQCFVALIEEGSFTRAAERVHATQPGISVLIGNLEREFGVKLVERHARGIRPTHAGERLYRRSLDILRAVEEAKSEMAELKGSLVGEVSFGLPPTFCMGLATGLLARFTTDHPHVDLRLVEAYSADLVQAVSTQRLEFAVATSTPTERGLELSLLHRDHFVLLTPGEPGGGFGEPTALRDLKSLRLVMPSRQQTLGALIHRLLQVHGLTDVRVLEVDGLLTTIDMVRRAGWSALMPTIALGEDITTGPFRVVPLTDVTADFEYYLVHSAAIPLSAAARVLIDYMRTDIRQREESHKYPV